MRKRINSTNRRKITQNNIQISVDPENDWQFQATLHLREYSFSKKAKVIIEVTCAGNSLVKRFDDIGTIGELKGEVQYKNSLLPLNAKRFTFYIKIVDIADDVGKILGFAKVGIQCSSEDCGIFGAQLSSELGFELWKLDFDESGEMVVLVNERCSELCQRLETDEQIQALMMPLILRSALEHALESRYEDWEDSCSLRQCLRLGARLHPDGTPPPDDESDDEDAKKEWVDAVLGEFCKKHDFVQMYNREMDSNS